MANAGSKKDLDFALGRLISLGTALSVVLLGLGVVAMLAGGHSPLDAGLPGFVPSELLPALAAGRPEGFLGAGLVVAIATPAARVAGALIGSIARRDLLLAAIGAAILVVMAAGTVLALTMG